MSNPDENAFAGLPFFGDMMKAFSSQGPLQWDVARQIALTTALDGNTVEGNVDPADRIILETLAPIAQLHVETHTGLSTTPNDHPRTLLVVNKTTWCHLTLEAYKPMFTTLASSLSGADVIATESSEPGPENSMASMMSGLSKLLAPAMMGMSVGSMVGNMSRHAFGQYDIPLPREPIHQLILVSSNITSFASDWSIPIDDVRMWVLIQELTAHAVLGVGHVRETISNTVRRYVAGFRPNPTALFDRMTEIEVTGSDPMAMLQKFLSDPSLIFGAVRSKEQEALSPTLDAMVAAIIGYIDHSVDAIASRLLGGGSQIAEAVRRRRVESSANDVFLEQLLGLRLTRQQLERGRLFIDGVIERAGSEGIGQLFSAADHLPTPSELDAPGLWLARLEIQ